MIAEFPRVWLGPMPALRWEGLDVVEAAYQDGKGIIFLTPHMGCFELAARATAARFSPQYGDLTVLFRPGRRPAVDRLLEIARAGAGLQTAPTNLAGVRQLMRALRAGKAVGLLPDQVPPADMGLWSPFFGRPAYTMTLAARLALQSGAPMVLAWGERRPWGAGYILHFSAMPSLPTTDLDTAVAHTNRAMEALIRQCPAQYLWAYPRYKNPAPAEGVAASLAAGNAQTDALV
jgi:KDO2-lipid IV(A) lauroyltransferase